VKDEHEPVTSDEWVFRRIVNAQDWCNLSLPQPIQYVAFKPRDNEDDGISVYRADCGVTADAVAASGPSAAGYFVASLSVADITSIDIDGMKPTVIPSPQPTGPRGHASIPELNVKLRNGDKRRYRLLADKLAKLASAKIVFKPN
jgi:hypothetical protein